MPVSVTVSRLPLARRWMIPCVTAAILMSAAVAPVLPAQASGLTLAEVVGLRQQGVSPQRILRSAREYCVAFALTDSARRALGAAGADSVLIVGLRDVCRSAPPRQSAPATLIDEDFSGNSTVDELLWDESACAMHPERNGLRLQNTSRQGACIVGYPTGPLRGDVRIQMVVADLGMSSGAIALFGFGLQPNTQGQLSLSVTADRRVELCRAAQTHCERLFYAERVSAVHDGRTATNLIGVEIRGREVSIVINGQTIGKYTSDQDLSGGVTFGVGPGSNLLFGYLRAVALSPSSGGPS